MSVHRTRGATPMKVSLHVGLELKKTGYKEKQFKPQKRPDCVEQRPRVCSPFSLLTPWGDRARHPSLTGCCPARHPALHLPAPPPQPPHPLPARGREALEVTKAACLPLVQDLMNLLGLTCAKCISGSQKPPISLDVGKAACTVPRPAWRVIGLEHVHLCASF